MFPQGTTQYDALGHAWYGDKLYNGFDPKTTIGGLQKCSIQPIAEHGVIGRGVLIDAARYKGKKHLDRDEGFTLDDPNSYYGEGDEPAYQLEPGDPGYVPTSPPPPKPKRKPRKYMASNPTPDPIGELIASGEDLCDGLNQHAAAIGIKQNTFALTRADLDALIAARDAQSAAEGAQPAAYAALRTADSNGKGFIARAIKVLSIALGDGWSDAWIATGLPNNTVGIPNTQDARFAALGGLKAYFTANSARENAPLNVTAAIAGTLYGAISDARLAVNNALTLTKNKVMAKGDAKAAFGTRYRGAIGELEQLLEADDPKWYDFGLNRPADSAQPGQPSNVHGTALGGARVMVQIDGARRANSFNYYKQVIGVDAQPVKVRNDQATEIIIEGLPVGATVSITVTGVNDAGEGQPSEAVNVVVT